MGIFDQIKDAIWGTEKASPAATPSKNNPVMADAAQGVTADRPGPPKTVAQGAPIPAARPEPVATSSGEVDVAAMLDTTVKRKGQRLQWRTSIVDLMKALDLDSSLGSRKELAKELNYDGATDGSAKMNMWLHKALMKKLAENGGRVPQELLD